MDDAPAPLTITEARLDECAALAELIESVDGAMPCVAHDVLHSHSVVARRGEELVAAVISTRDASGVVHSRYIAAQSGTGTGEDATPHAHADADATRRVVVAKACKKLRSCGIRAGRVHDDLGPAFWAGSRFIQPIDLLPAAAPADAPEPVGAAD